MWKSFYDPKTTGNWGVTQNADLVRFYKEARPVLVRKITLCLWAVYTGITVANIVSYSLHRVE